MQKYRMRRMIAVVLALIMMFSMPMSVLANTGYSSDNGVEGETVSRTVETSSNAQEVIKNLQTTSLPEDVVISATPSDAQEDLMPETSSNASEGVFNTESVSTPSNAMITFLAINGFKSETHDVFKSTESIIAPGVTQSINYAYAKDGKQMVYYVINADVTRDDVVVQTSYKDQYVDKKFGMEKLTNHMAFADKLYTDETSDRFISEYYKAVAGVNASFYNMTTGQPSGVTYLDGVQIGESASYNQFFAILKDGTAIIDRTSNLSAYKGEIWQAAAGSQMLVWDGKDVTANASGSYNTDRHSRTCVGVTEDGQVVLMTLDGRQEPFSCGGTMHELAQIMLEQGCVAAINLDGGGSSTFAARQEGENEVTIVNRPSDGSERSISSGIIVGSLAVPSDVFDRASLTVENNYVTPGSTVEVKAAGVSPAGTAAEIPEGVEWKLEDNTFGTIKDGVFVSNGTAGDVVIQMEYNDYIVGETTVHVVIPEKLEFNQEEMVVPYGKTVTIGVTATHGLNEVILKDGDVSFKLTDDDSIGSFNYFEFTAVEEGTTSGNQSTIVATLTSNSQVTASGVLSLGKGSEVVMDFEEFNLEQLTIKTGYPQYGPKGEQKDSNGNYYYNGQNEVGTIELVTKENGQVHDGEYALAVECDFSQAYETGYHMLTLRGLGIAVPANAQAIGMWIHIPELEELYSTSLRFFGATEGATTNDVTSPWLWDNCQPYGWSQDGWRYVTMDLSGYSEAMTINGIQLYICDRDNTAVDFVFKDHASVNGRFTYYLDNITLDYSSAVDDREIPIFSSVRYAFEGMSDAVELNGQTVKNSVVDFGAVVHEDTTKNNYTGLDDSTAKAYIDGVEVDFSYSGGTFAISGVVLADGVHSVKFEISDMMGNTAYVTRYINVDADSELSKVFLEPADPSADKILIGSLYWMNVVASDIEKIDSVTMNLNLNSMSQWELEGMSVAAGFTAEYDIDTVTNNATITITKTGDVQGTGEVALAKLPIRTWESRLTEYEGYESQTPEKLWSRKIIWPIDIKLSSYMGQIEFTDGTTGSFSMKPISVITELYGNYGELNANGDYSNKKSWHVHNAVALNDEAASCLFDGYENRTFCEDCNSVVEWGTILPATGHNYDFVEGVLQCTNEECGETFTGVYTDGKEYIDGVVVGGEAGWVGDSYYVDGVKLTGVQLVPSPENDGEFYYNFGEDGVSTGKYTGLFYDETTGVYRYSQFGELSSGWKSIDGNWHYFRESTLAAAVGVKHEYNVGITYTFAEDGRVLDGVWKTDDIGTRYYYGPTYYRCASTNTKAALFVIDGKTYAFGHDGYRYEGIRSYKESNGLVRYWYDFGTDGILKGVVSGLVSEGNGTYYVVDGVAEYAGLIKIGDYYYYVRSNGQIVTGTYYVYKTNDIFPEGYYDFDEDGKMILAEEKNGIVDGHYYIDGVMQKGSGLVYVDGYYYYVRTNGELATGSYWVNTTNGYMPYGYYNFDEDGKMILVEEKNGIVDGHYYIDGVMQKGSGLVYIDGYYYYVRTNGELATGSYWVNTTNGYMPYGYYDFDEDGKMILVEEKNGIVDGHYYIDGVMQKGSGLVYIDGYYYYVRTNGELATGSYWVNTTNGYMPYGYYDFDEDGKMILAEEKNGIVDGHYYIDGVMQKGSGLVYDDGYYYYVRTNGELATGNYWVNTTNGYMPYGYYDFDEDGKMIL